MAWKGRKYYDVDFDSLQVTLVNSRLQQQNPALFTTLQQLLIKLRQNKEQVNTFFETIIGNIDIDTSNNLQAILARILSFANAQLLTWNDESLSLAYSRQLLAGDGITFDDSVANQRTISTTLKVANVVLTDTQIKALPTTPFELIASPGVSSRISLINADLYLDASAGAYTNISSSSMGYIRLGSTLVSSYFGDDSSPSSSRLVYFLGQSAIKQATLLPYIIPDIVSGWGNTPNIITGDLTNDAMELYVDNAGLGDFTGGNAANTLTINIAYMVL